VIKLSGHHGVPAAGIDVIWARRWSVSIATAVVSAVPLRSKRYCQNFREEFFNNIDPFRTSQLT
jgi:hypothetical protein